MSQYQDTPSVQAHAIPPPTEIYEAMTETSMLYQVLPAIVQSRMPKLPSLRRSMTGYCAGTMHAKNSNSLAELSLPATPPPGYTSRPVSGSTTPWPTSVASASLFEFDDDACTAGSAPITAYETTTGISWHHAKHGIAGITEASRKASAAHTGEDNSLMTDMIRSQYLYNLTVLLRSLPQTLSAAEKMNIRAALPDSMLESGYGAQPQALATTGDTYDVCQEPQPRTALECATAWLVFRLFLLIQMVLPYIKQLVRLTAQLEHDHQITRRALKTSFVVGSDVSRRVSQAVCRLNEGVAGEVLSNATVYCAESIAGGIQQGLMEAKRSRQAANRRRGSAVTS
ncbi:hypothetical protein ACEQ8H_008833 [Pleosporales sp. CAS-2024a]